MAVAGIVLAGGRSSRMGTAKAWLDWHGTPLLRHVTSVVAAAVDGPVVVVAAPGQELPALASDVRVVADPVAGRGPVQGLATGLSSLDADDIAFVCATDLPFLHGAFIRAVTAALGAHDAAVPLVAGRRQPLAAAYRASVAAVASAQLRAGRPRLMELLDRLDLVTVDETTLRAVDPSLAAVVNLNTDAEYRRALLR